MKLTIKQWSMMLKLAEKDYTKKRTTYMVERDRLRAQGVEESTYLNSLYELQAAAYSLWQALLNQTL